MSRQTLILDLDEITAGDYLQWIRDPEPPALDSGLRSIHLEADPLGATVTAVLDWAGTPPPARVAGPAAGLPLADGIRIREPERSAPVHRSGGRITSRILAAVVALGLLLALAGPASARGTIGYDGTTMTFTGDAAVDIVSVGPSEGELAWTTSGLDAIPPQCAAAEYVDYRAYCPWPQRIVVRLGGGNDRFTTSATPWDPFPVNVVVESFGGDGDDRLQSGNTQDGGAGNDTLEGHDGSQMLHGGPGDDSVSGLAGSDQVYGDDGNDTVSGDTHKAASPDVIDGGPGFDRIEQDWSDGDSAMVLTLAGGADDGRPGEGDDVRSVEDLKSFQPGRYVGTEGADRIELVQIEGSSSLTGAGGDDLLKASDGTDTLDGGAGADTLDGGFGDDTIVGGPGPDAITGDRASGECGIYYCKLPHGNDTIDARDGERDSVTCSVGADTVRADAVDTVAPDCETVDRGTDPRTDHSLRRAQAPRPEGENRQGQAPHGRLQGQGAHRREPPSPPRPRDQAERPPGQAAQGRRARDAHGFPRTTLTDDASSSRTPYRARASPTAQSRSATSLAILKQVDGGNSAVLAHARRSAAPAESVPAHDRKRPSPRHPVVPRRSRPARMSSRCRDALTARAAKPSSPTGATLTSRGSRCRRRQSSALPAASIRRMPPAATFVVRPSQRKARVPRRRREHEVPASPQTDPPPFATDERDPGEAADPKTRTWRVAAGGPESPTATPPPVTWPRG